MAGIYIHIPYCKKACHYCDFHFSVNSSNRAELVAALLKEDPIDKYPRNINGSLSNTKLQNCH